MRILALIKNSLDITEIKVDPNSGELRLAGVPERIGAIDKNVVEAAVRLKETYGGSACGISFGPAEARDNFKDVLAMGLDEIVLIEDSTKGEASAGLTVRALKAAVRALGAFDLILCGFASDDGYTYQTGPRLAERLGLPLVSYARAIEASEGKVRVEQDLEDCIQLVAAPLPCIISIAEEAFPPRRTTLMDAIKAKKKPISIWRREDHLELEEAFRNAPASAPLLEKTGVIVRRKQQIFKSSDLCATADQLIDCLISDGILTEENA